MTSDCDSPKILTNREAFYAYTDEYQRETVTNIEMYY